MSETVCHMPERKIEQALKALIEDLDLGFDVYTRFDDSADVDSSRILILCEDADPQLVGETVTGNWTLDVQISLKTMRADVTGESHDAAVGAIADLLFSSDIVDQLNGAGVEELTVFSAYPGPRKNSISDEHRETVQRVSIFMMPSTEEEPDA